MINENEKQHHEKAYQQWYWNVLVQDALKRILPLCKSSDKNFDFKGNETDFLELIKYLKTWQESYPNMDAGIKRDLETINNFNEKPVAA